MTDVTTAVERSVRKARRRLIADTLLNSLFVGWAAALAVGIVWLLAEPWVMESPGENLRWYVLGGATALATLAVIVRAWWLAPSRQSVALEVDNRFDLKERVTTALGLAPADQATSAGQAVLADALGKVAALKVSDKFPVRPRWHAAFVPTLAAALVLAVLFYHPDTAGAASEDELAARAKDAAATANAEAKKKPEQPFVKPKPPELDRKGKSKEIEKLEEELGKLAEKWAKHDAETPEKKREKVTELTAMEEKIKKFNAEKEQKLEQLGKQLQQLDRLNKDKEFADGPAKELNDALAKGDIKKAEGAIDELKKKIKDQKLDAEEQKKLDRQLGQMKKELEQLNKENEKKEEKLKEMIKKAKQENRDAEALERELQKLKDEMKENAEQGDRMAERMQKMQNALKKGDLDELASELDKMGQDLKVTENELQDLEDAQEYLQKLRDEMKKACKACEGDCDKPGHKDFANGKGVASGERDIDRGEKTTSSEERVRGHFNPLGRKSFGGTTRGPAFTKQSDAQFGKEIQQAVQEAPQAVETQRLPRDAQQSVREYFEKLGETGKK